MGDEFRQDVTYSVYLDDLLRVLSNCSLDSILVAGNLVHGPLLAPHGEVLKRFRKFVKPMLIITILFF